MSVIFHFLNVGSGDCTIVHFPARVRKDGRHKNERIMMVDIYHDEGNKDYENVIAYYKAHFKNPDGSLKPIFRFVCTHPHQDHICGLEKLLNDQGIGIFNFWDISHSFEPEDFEGHPTHEEDWKAYRKLGSEASTETVIRITRESAARQFWDDEEDRITILSPSRALVKYAHYKEDGTKRDSKDIEIDEMSYALLIRVNNRKVILAGDGRATPCWKDIYDNCKGDIKNCAVLKAGHHGHETSFHEEALKLMNPALIIFSNSKEEDKDNGAEREYKKTVPAAIVLKTCDRGTIVVEVPFDRNKPITYV